MVWGALVLQPAIEVPDDDEGDAMKSLDKYRGCLMGGAAGDALGYTVEFLDESAIFQRFGLSGITEYELVEGVAQISDDTQMTLFTANGLLLGTTRGMVRGIMGSYPSYVALCYKDWLQTQTGSYPLDTNATDVCSWLVNVSELFHRRAPGLTCISAIQSGAYGTIEHHINDSKGCGGVMRVAPVGLYFEPKGGVDDELDRIGAEVAAITHGHELGYIPAATLTHIIRRLAHEDVSVEEAVTSSIDATERLFPHARELPVFIDLMHRAMSLSQETIDDLDAIHELGQGWVGDEALAIAVYCALKYPDDFEKAIVAAVNHNGDSDSTGAIAGSIVGTHVGLSGIPAKYVEHLELADVIVEIADDLYNDCKIDGYSDYRDPVWERKYIEMTYSM